MTGAGCLSRVMGPVFVSYIYTRMGTIWTFGITTAMMALSMLWLKITDKRMVIPQPSLEPEPPPQTNLVQDDNCEDIEIKPLKKDESKE